MTVKLQRTEHISSDVDSPATLSEIDYSSMNNESCNEMLDKHGYLIIRNILPLKIQQLIQEELEPYFQNRPLSKGLFWGEKTTRIEAVLNKSKTSHSLVIHPDILGVVNHVLGDNCDNFQLSLTQGIRIHPGENAQPLHPDTAKFPIPKPFEFMFNAIWALSEFSEENGGTQLVPGSHRWEAGREPTEDEIISATMQPGDVLLYRASLLHGGGANKTKSTPRTGLAISYSLGWLRQSENMFLTYPPHIAKTFEPKLQKLIGYDVHRPNIGWVNGHHPDLLLSDKKHENIGAEDFLTDEQNRMLKEFRSGNSVTVDYKGGQVTSNT